MVNYQESALSSTFAALADPTRRAIVAMLASGDRGVGDLAAPFDMSLPAISKHLKVLQRAGLVLKRREGRQQRCTLSANKLGAAAAWLSSYRRFWEEQLERFAAHVEEEHQQEEVKRWPQPIPSRRSASAEPSRRHARKSSPPGRRRNR